MGCKLKKVIFLLFLAVAVIIPCRAAEPEMRGVWVSTVYNLDYPSAAGLSSAQMMAEADEIIASAAAAGMNTIFLQVRPCCDAIYPSDIFPWSKYISGAQGVSPEGNFDALDYFIDQCHRKGMELHAWINPFRVTVSTFTSIEEGLSTLHNEHPAALNPEWVRLGIDGRLYFDPALPPVRELITDGVKEILEKYDVDGIHLDDYFYPDGAFDDSESYTRYGFGFSDINDFRRDNVNQTVKALYETVKAYDISFGISPFGIWANASSNPSGSYTVGNQSYYSHYADSLKWIEEGWLDYIAPQLYWSIGSREGEFETLLLWWRNAVNDSGVDLYIGLAAYRTAESDSTSEWYNGTEIIAQLDMIDIYGQTDGVIFFRHNSINESDPLFEHMSDRYDYPMPHIGQPIFMQDAPQFYVISPKINSHAVEDSNITVECIANAGSGLYAMSGNSLNKLITSDLQYKTTVEVNKVQGLTFICEQNNVISIKTTTVKLLNSDKKCSLTDIDCNTEEDYTVVTFRTDFPAAASCSKKNRFITLTVAPCRTGLLFECPQITYMVTEKTNIGIRYTFALKNDVQDCYIKEYNDRIVLYFK